MKNIYLTTLLILAPLTISAQKSKEADTLDKYHTVISNWVMDSSDSIDRFLSGKKDTEKLSTTKIKISYEVGTYNTGGFSNSLGFGMSLSLPRFKDKAKFTFEKVSRETSLFGNNKENILSKKDDTAEDSYNLALKYSQWGGKRTKIGLTGGVRFNKVFFEPYVGVIAGYKIKDNDKENISIKNTLRFYLAGEIKNSISGQYLYNYSPNILLGWRGDIEYSNKNRDQNFLSEFIWHKYVNDYKFYRVGFISSATLTNFKDPKKDNFEIYSKYHNKLMNKDWLYYEVTPSLNWRKKDNYDTSVGIKFKIGATFGGAR